MRSRGLASSSSQPTPRRVRCPLQERGGGGRERYLDCTLTLTPPRQPRRSSSSDKTRLWWSWRHA